MLILIAAVLGLGLGLGQTMIEMGPSPQGTVVRQFSRSVSGQPADGPRVVVDEDTFEFGTMAKGASLSHEFMLRNTGTEELRLKEGQTSCRCTEFEVLWKKVPPGESTPVKIKWEATVQPGPFRQTANIETNDPSQPRVTLTITGAVAMPYRVSPAELVFSSIPSSAKSTAELRLYSYQQPDVKVLGHQFSDSTTADKFSLRIEPMPAVVLAGEPAAKSGLLVHVTVAPGMPLGVIRQLLSMTLNLPDETTVEVPIGGEVISDVQVVGRGWDVDRSLVDFGVVNGRVGEKIELFIQARGPHRKSLKPKLHRVDSDILQVRIGEPVEAADGTLVRCPLTIEIPPGSHAAVHLGNQQGKLAQMLIDTGLPEAESLRMWVRFAVGE